MAILYKLTFPNGKLYIGITSKTLHRRLITHRSHAKERDFPVHRAIRKHPDFRADVLVVADNMDFLRDLEKRAIAAFGTTVPGGYNLSPGGDIIRGPGVSETTRARLRENGRAYSLRGQKLPGQFGNQATLGYRHTPEAKAKIAAAGAGAVFTQERRAKIGASKRGNTYNVGRSCSEVTKRKISEAQLGKKCPARSRAQRGKKKSDAARAAMSLGQRARQRRVRDGAPTS